MGHALLLDGEMPVSEPEEFGRRFRQEILPLLQDYCYDDYTELAHYLGDQIINSREGTLNMEILADDDRLIEALTAVVHEGTVA
ncbi:MAG: hypothetical protein IPM53_29985 [Anaerolineaceae bacterium]|nr:hypothetical protein [Anaerolineaceae bacterium]